MYHGFFPVAAAPEAPRSVLAWQGEAPASPVHPLRTPPTQAPQAALMNAEPTPTIAPKRHGKRKLADARDQWVHVRCNAAEHATITAAAAQKGLTAGPYLRSLALGTPGPRARRQPSAERAELARVLGLLGNYGSNLNQLAHVANASGKLPIEAALAEIAQNVREIRDHVMQALGRGD